MGKRLICLCNLVDENEILELMKKGAKSTEDIQKFARAGSSCGRCLTEIDELVKRYNKNKPKDQQKKLNLGF